jgi:hypothetical protein
VSTPGPIRGIYSCDAGHGSLSALALPDRIGHCQPATPLHIHALDHSLPSCSRGCRASGLADDATLLCFDELLLAPDH